MRITPLVLENDLIPPACQTKFARAIADPYRKRTANRAATIIIMIVAYPEWLASHFGRDSPAKTGAGLNPCAHVGTLSSRCRRNASVPDLTATRTRAAVSGSGCAAGSASGLPGCGLAPTAAGPRFGGRATATGTFRGRPGPRFGAGPGSGVAATGSSGGATSTGGRIATGRRERDRRRPPDGGRGAGYQFELELVAGGQAELPAHGRGQGEPAVVAQADLGHGEGFAVGGRGRGRVCPARPDGKGATRDRRSWPAILLKVGGHAAITRER